MINTTIKIEKRDEVGGGRARRLLKRGLIPAVVYGRDMGSTAALVNGSELKRFLRSNGRSSVYNMEFAEEHDLPMLIKNIQYDPVSKEMIHLDFQRVNNNEKVQVKISVRVKNIESLKKNGKVVVHQMDSVTVECLPGDIPQYADVDITDMMPGQSFTAGNFKFAPGVSLISKPTKVVFTVKDQGHEQEAIPKV